MSAISGIFGQNQPVDNCVIDNTCKLLKHCGKESDYVNLTLNSSNRGICHNAITTLYSNDNNKPLWNEKNNIYIALDGEIYNTDELKDCLKKNNISVINGTDTEILLKFYEQYGLRKMLNMLDGTWAICIVDQSSNTTYVIRDRMGEKPLYYYQKENTILFASALKAFYAFPSFEPELNEESVSEYFVFRYPCGNSTFLQGVNLVSPGCYLAIKDNIIHEQPYWMLPQSKSNNLSKEENKRHLKRLIQKSVARRLKYRERIGAQLSGGVDSSYVCAEMKRQLDSSFNTFSITFEGADVDESKYIDHVNQMLNLKAHKFDCKPSDFLNNWGKATWHYESPINHEGTVPLLELNRQASGLVDTILCGDGADESLGGYPIFRRIDSFKRNLHGLRWLGVKFKALLKGKPHFSSLDEHFISLHQFIPDDQLKHIRPDSYKRDIKTAYKKRLSILKRFKKNDFLHKYTNYDLCTYGLDCLLRTEKMAMASGLTIRSPFLMTELQEFIQTIPPKYLTDYTRPYMQSTKILLKELCADEFGDDFTYRPKIGLGIPVAAIFKDIQFRNYIECNILPSIKNRRIVDYDYIEKLWNDSISYSDNKYYSQLELLWCSLSFEVWAQMYLESNVLSNK